MLRSISLSVDRIGAAAMRGMLLMSGLVALAITCIVAAEAPLSFSASGHIVAPARINGGDQYLFVVDTGAEGSAVYARFAQEAELERGGEEMVVGQTGIAAAPLRRIMQLEFDGVRVGPILASELPDRADGAVMAGIIGLDVMGRHLVDFDLPAGRVALLQGPAADALIASLGPAHLARTVNGGLLAVPVQVNGVLGWGVIDTGARETRINTRFARIAGVEDDRDGVAKTVHGATNRPIALRAGNTQTVRLLGRQLDRPSVRVADLPVFDAFGLQDEPAMIIGADYLGRFRLLIDFPTRRVWLR